MGRRCTCRDDRERRALETVHDRQVSRDHIDNSPRNEERRYFPYSTFFDGLLRILDQRQPANPGSDIDSNAFGVIRMLPDAGVGNSFHTCHQPVVNKRVDTTRFFRGQILSYVEVFDLASDLRGKRRCIKTSNSANTRFTCKDVRPRFGGVVTNGTNCTQPGNNDAAP